MIKIDLEELSIGKIHKLFKEKELNSATLVAAYLKRIEVVDQCKNGQGLNAIATVNKNAVKRAKELDSSFSKTGSLVGPLHGIPVVVKDHIMTKSLTTTFGSIVAKDFVPNIDSTVVKKLYEAGAVILAKASLPDFGTDYFSTSSIFGNVRNPYDPDRDPGASSSGTAVAVAANLATIGVGSDSAGSIRLPASFCNVVGFRPTVGLISGYGSSPGILGQSTIGPMGRNVRDVALMMDVLCGFEENDNLTSIHARSDLPNGGSYASELDKLPQVSDVRVGVISGMFGDEETAEGRAVNTVMNSAIKRLVNSNVTTVQIVVPNLEKYLRDSSLFLTRAQYDLNQFLQPTLGIDLAEIASSGRCPPENVMIPYISRNGADNPYIDGNYGQQVDTREEFERVMQSLMMKHNITAFIFPAVKIPPPRFESIDWKMRAELPLNAGFASQLRWPSICVPAGFTTLGLPVGMEISAPPLRDQKILNIASIVEQVIDARRPPVLATHD